MTASLDPVLVEDREPQHPDVVDLITAQQREIAGIEGESHVSFPVLAAIEFLVGYAGGRAVACGALQRLEPGVGEIKRMYVVPTERGRGLSRTMLATLETLAASRGMHTVRLETGRFLPAALRLYATSGYREIPLFGHYVGHETSICFEKALATGHGAAVDNR